MSYSKNSIRYCLRNYLELAKGNLPRDNNLPLPIKRKKSIQSSPMEAAICMKVDMDNAVGALAPQNEYWLKVLCYISLGEGINKYFNKLSQTQQSLLDYFVLNPRSPKNLEPYHIGAIVKKLYKFLNKLP